MTRDVKGSDGKTLALYGHNDDDDDCIARVDGDGDTSDANAAAAGVITEEEEVINRCCLLFLSLDLQYNPLADPLISSSTINLLGRRGA